LKFTKITNHSNSHFKPGTGYGSHLNNIEWDITKFIDINKNNEVNIINILKDINNHIKINKCVIPEELCNFIITKFNNINLLVFNNNINMYKVLIETLDLIITSNIIININVEIIDEIKIIINNTTVDENLMCIYLYFIDVMEKYNQNNKKCQSLLELPITDNKDAYIKMIKENNYGTTTLDSSHRFYNDRKQTISPKTIVRIMSELSSLKKDLPINWDSSVIMRIIPSNTNLLSFIITGPKDTPYHNGLFEFHAYFPDNYPNSVPKVLINTTDGGNVRFNPNLYNNGKVCLSLLGTWSGEKGENWIPEISTFFQVIISIQSLILVDEPYFNEPGYESSMNTTEVKKQIKMYNENIRYETIRVAMLGMLKDKPSIYKTFIEEHFKFKKNEIIETATKWYEESINKNKFANTKIGFVIKVKDSNNFTIKQPLESSLILSLSLRDNSVMYSQAVFESNTQLISAELLDGIYKGTLTFPNSALSGAPLQNVYIQALYYPLNQVNYNGETLALNGELIGFGSTQTEFSSSTAIAVSGRSDYFNIYPVEGIYTIAKINEDIDMTQQFKDISLQPLFLNNNVLYDEFLAKIFGTIESSQTSIGKLTYEKISNFISNNKILDYSNINSLYSILEELNIDTLKFSENNYRYPADLARLIDLLSINKSRLFGGVNYYNENFDTRGYQDSELYGKNLGAEISIFDTISAGQPILSYERFGNVFKILNTYQPVSIVGSSYSIVNYTNDWGWGLVLPDTGYGDKISNYYTFYNHITTFDGTITDSIINFADSNNTLTHNISSYSDWSERDGIIANLISNQLYKGLNLFD
jgi:ubiquitin-protein ligase